MKLRGNTIFENQISLLSLFRNGRSPAVTWKKGGSGNELGWSLADMKLKRLVAFVKGIRVTGTGITAGSTNAVNEFMINIDTFDYDNLTLRLQRVSSNGPVDMDMDHTMSELGNHVKISYWVDHPGRYVLDIKYHGMPVPSSPFKINIRECETPCIQVPSAKHVIASGKGLKTCNAGEITAFYLNTKKAGSGQVSVIADGNMNIPLRITEVKNGFKVHYLAKMRGSFFLRVKFNGNHIPGSPFMITAESKVEISEMLKHLFKHGLFAGIKDDKTDLQP